MLFQNTIDHIDSEISQLLAQVEAKKQQQTQLTELDALTDSTLEGLADVVTKVGHYDRNAIASLKTAVLTLFDSGDNGNDGGNEPTDPTPGLDDDEPELLCLNGLTGECLTTVDIDDEEFPVDDPMGDEWVLSSEAPLTGQTCAVSPDLYWETTPPNGSSWALVSPLACLIWEDAPLLGQHCTISPTNNENEGSDLGEATPYVELVQHPENAALAYQRKHDGQIICTYLGFRTKALASSWLRAVEVITSAVELRQAKRLEGFKWELKAKDLTINQINRFASEDLTKTYLPESSGTNPPNYEAPVCVLPASLGALEPGDIVMGLLTPSASYKIIQILPNGILDCENLVSGSRLGLKSRSVTLVQKAETLLTTKQPPSQQFAKVLLEKSEYFSQTFPILKTSENNTGYTLTLPNGDNRWYRADMVEIVDAPVEVEELTPKVESISEPEETPIAFNDLVEVVADSNDTVGLIGAFGRVKVVKGSCIGVEVDEQLVFFKPDELKVKSKAVAPTQSRNQLPSADVSLSDQEATYLQTNGNYLGLAKQTRQRWEQAGINPSDLIADMRANRPTEPAWDAAKYNPVLAAISSEYDF